MEIANVQTIAGSYMKLRARRLSPRLRRRPPLMSNGERANRLKRGGGLKRPNAVARPTRKLSAGREEGELERRSAPRPYCPRGSKTLSGGVKCLSFAHPWVVTQSRSAMIMMA